MAHFKGGKKKQCVHVQSESCVPLFAIPWTVARQAPLSMRFSRQEYWSGLPFSSLRNLTNPEIETASPAGRFFTSGPPGKPKNPIEILVRDS